MSYDLDIWPPHEVFYMESMLTITRTAMTNLAQLQFCLDELYEDRAADEAIKTGTTTIYNNTDVIAFEKKSGTDDVLILVNARNNAVNYQVPPSLQNTSWTDGMTNATETLSAQLTLSTYQYIVLKKN